MCTNKRGLDAESSDSDLEEEAGARNDDEDSTSLSEDSDISSDSEPEEGNLTAASANETDHPSDNEQADEEEDEVIKAIRQENRRQRNHPPPIKLDDIVFDISFHPHEDLLAVATITGDVLLYMYSNDANTLQETLELHTKSCRDIEFSEDGQILFSTSEDRTIMVSDVATGKLKRFYDMAHNCPVYCLSVLTENLIATGDDDGTVKLWDIRDHRDNQILQFKKNEDYISDIVTEDSKRHLLCSSGDGSLVTYDIQERKFLMQSEELEEITSLGIVRNNSKLAASSSNGKLYLFNWNEFGAPSDVFTGYKPSINKLLPITENIVVTACEDGNLRATHLFPHKPLGIVGQHELSVESLDICNNGQFIGSSSHNDVKFWNIEYFEDFERVSSSASSSKNKNKRTKDFNLPSSKRQNVGDFFSDLC